MYNVSIDALLEYYLKHSSYRPQLISGGERRDWFFSIPIARKLNLPHIFLYKSGDFFITDPEGNSMNLDLQDQKVLHVADIINHASSYLNRWIPILKSAGVDFRETLTVAVRNQEGVVSLEQNNVNSVSPLIVDRSLFEDAHRLGLIQDFALIEIKQFYDSLKEWTRSFLSEAAKITVN